MRDSVPSRRHRRALVTGRRGSARSDAGGASCWHVPDDRNGPWGGGDCHPGALRHDTAAGAAAADGGGLGQRRPRRPAAPAASQCPGAESATEHPAAHHHRTGRRRASRSTQHDRARPSPKARPGSRKRRPPPAALRPAIWGRAQDRRRRRSNRERPRCTVRLRRAPLAETQGDGHAEDAGLFRRQDHRHHRRRQRHRPRHRADLCPRGRQRRLRRHQRGRRQRDRGAGQRQGQPGAGLEGRRHQARRRSTTWSSARSMRSARVQFLFNSAGAAIRRAKFLEIDDALMEKTFDLNVKGTLYGMQAVLPHMLANKFGVIVNIGSMAHRRGGPGSLDPLRGGEGRGGDHDHGRGARIRARRHPRAVDLARAGAGRRSRTRRRPRPSWSRNSSTTCRCSASASRRRSASWCCSCARTPARS